MLYCHIHIPYTHTHIRSHLRDVCTIVTIHTHTHTHNRNNHIHNEDMNDALSHESIRECVHMLGVGTKFLVDSSSLRTVDTFYRKNCAATLSAGGCLVVNPSQYPGRGRCAVHVESSHSGKGRLDSTNIIDNKQSHSMHHTQKVQSDL